VVGKLLRPWPRAVFRESYEILENTSYSVAESSCFARRAISVTTGSGVAQCRGSK